MESIYLELTNLTNNSLLIQDVRDGINQSKVSRPGPVYIPANGTIQLAFSSTVVLSYEGGVIRGYVNDGAITATIKFGSDFSSAMAVAERQWANYANLAATQVLVPGVWTVMQNDMLGTQTILDYLPDTVPSLYDPVTSKIDLQYMPVGSMLDIRVNFDIIPVENNAAIGIRLHFPSFGSFYLTQGQGRLDNGAGISYSRVENFHFYIGYPEVQTDGCYVEIRCSSQATLTPFGYYMVPGGV